MRAVIEPFPSAVFAASIGVFTAIFKLVPGTFIVDP